MLTFEVYKNVVTHLTELVAVATHNWEDTDNVNPEERKTTELVKSNSDDVERPDSDEKTPPGFFVGQGCCTNSWLR